MSSAPVPRPMLEAARVDQAELNKARQHYRFRGDGVDEFLAERPKLIELLLSAYPQVERLFGKGTPISLEVVTDPEYPAPPEIFAYIGTQLAVDQALGRLNQFDDWYLGQSDDLAGELTFSVEFA